MIARAGRFVFGCRDTLSLELLRAGVGLALLLSFVPVSFDLEALYGPDGWISAAAAAEIGGGGSPLSWLDAPWQRAAFHLVFLAACTALAIGWRTRWVKWLAWAGFLAYVRRNPAMVYGVDRLLASFLPVLCLAPVGRRWAVDRIRAKTPATDDADARASACLRLLQVQMALVFLFAGAYKLQGEMWWSGHALWIALHNFEFARWSSSWWGAWLGGWLAEHYGLVNLATHCVVLVELAYPFLIWDRRSRPWVLTAAALLHFGIAALMGLEMFALVALCGHAAFVPDAWWRRFGGWLRTAGEAIGRPRSFSPQIANPRWTTLRRTDR